MENHSGFRSILVYALFFVSTIAHAGTLTPLWTLDGFKNPESVVYDAKRKVLYVSNVNGTPPDKDGNGFISRVSPNGKMLDVEWVKGLNAPKGLAISRDKLYAADIDTLVEIDLKTGEISKRYTVPQAKFLNDVAADQAGNIYVSDMMDNAIYRLAGGVLDVWLKDAKLESPNGLYAEPGRLVTGAWGTMADGSNTQTPGHLKAISLRDKKITSLGDGTPVGNLDGVEADGHGAYYVTDWIAGKLMRIDAAGKVELLLTPGPGSADLTFIKSTGMLIIPMMHTHQLLAYTVQ